MNKEQLRKELEDAVDFGIKIEWAGYKQSNQRTSLINEWITTRLAALDDGDGYVEDHTVSNAIGAFDESLRVAQDAFPETDFNKKDSADDGQEGKGLVKKYERAMFNQWEELVGWLNKNQPLEYSVQEYDKWFLLIYVASVQALPLADGDKT